ncbi:MAG TPA: putative zinc-binding metallopeptidase, partial [Puia sp.]
YALGFDANTLSLITLVAENDKLLSNIQNMQEKFRYCKNAEYGTCNWLIHLSRSGIFCEACELNRMIPALVNDENFKRWNNIETAKHRLVYSLLRLRLPVRKKTGDEETGIAFDFLADISPKEKVITGHDNGVITLNIDEADEAERVRHKLDLGERYRTLLGHFRHEIGHYYWEVLIKNSDALEKYRSLFGDEENDYANALEEYYKKGAPANWSEYFISPYAASHSWEDWAETWAHYLHLMDTLETAFSFGIRIQPNMIHDTNAIEASIQQDPYDIADFSRIIRWWLPLTFAVNSLNRSMGHSDFYPFVISDPVVEKLKFIHELCFRNAGKTNH